jgi:hypothetical protein
VGRRHPAWAIVCQGMTEAPRCEHGLCRAAHGVTDELRVAGEVDLLPIEVLQGALTSSLARGPCHLLVDLADLTFCSVRGVSATASPPPPTKSTAPRPSCGRSASLPTQYPTATAGLAFAMAAGAPGTAAG